MARSAERAARRAGLLDCRSPALRRRSLGPVAPALPSRSEIAAYVAPRGAQPALVWSSPYLACEYVLDQDQLARYLARSDPAAAPAALRAVRTLLLLTTRNRLTHALCRRLLEVQRDFLRTGNEARLVPLTQHQLTAELRAAGLGAADPSRVSRLLRSTVIALPDGSRRTLRSLCPTSRAVLRAGVREILQLERRLQARGLLTRAWTDREMAQRIRPAAGLKISRRLVAYCRKSLGAPSAAQRARRGCYLSATLDFSPPAPLTRRAILARTPPIPGVYELRTAARHPRHQSRCAGIIYLGRTKNLQKRLLAHATPNGRNQELARHLAQGPVLFRFRIESRNLKRLERDLYRRFCETFGQPPRCNRMSP